MNNIKVTVAIMFTLMSGVQLYAQDFTAAQYKKAAWMATRFYGAQRSGIGPNWLTVDESSTTSFVKDETGGKNVAGGWFDCGDHVMFGQTQYYSVYTLLKAFETFPRGFHDLYSWDYSGYMSKNDFSYGSGKPNGIPDLIDELKYALDFVLKATGEDFFVYQKGNANYDHIQWRTAPVISARSITSGGESTGSRPIFKNPKGGAMAAMASASLALGSKTLRHFYGEAYGDSLLQNAKYAYDYAKRFPKTVGSETGDFYDPNVKFEDNIALAAAELFRATGDAKYLAVADEKAWGLSPHGHALNYNNEDDLAIYATAQATNDDSFIEKLRSDYVDDYFFSVNDEGVATNGDNSWGALRFPLTQAFMAAVVDKEMGETTRRSFVFDQIDYVLGSNKTKQSFVVGFCEGCNNSPQHPHHRGVYDNNADPFDKQSLIIPDDHKEFGALVGGSITSDSYFDEIEQYRYSEVCTDYNVGLVATLGYVLSQLDPAPVPNQKIKTVSLEVNWDSGMLNINAPKNGDSWNLKILSVDGKLMQNVYSIDGNFRYSPKQLGMFYAVLKNKGTVETFRFISE